MSRFSLMMILSLLFLLAAVDAAYFKSLGVNFGQLGDDLPSPAVSIHRIRHLRSSAVKIYDANPAVLRSLSGTRLAVSVMVPNDIIPYIAVNSSAADSWVAANILPFVPKTRIRFLLVGNEILSDLSIANSTWPYLVPAITAIHRSLKSHHLHDINVGTTLAMDALASSSCLPSLARFRPDIALPVVKPLLDFLNRTRSYYFVDAYTYFPWAANSTKIPLDYALLNPGAPKYTDPISNLTYTNLLDELLDSVVFAMKRIGYESIKICIAETGWPNAGDLDQIGANIHNAAVYNRNLARRMRALPPLGTPARPGWYIPTFVFALYNENQKPGPGTERHWGMLYPNGSRVYDLDLRAEQTRYGPLPRPTNNEPYKGRIWCVLAAAGRKLNETAVGAAASYACGQGKGTCDAIQKGGECYLPNTLAAHAIYAFNSYWQQFRKSGGTCYFGGLAVQTTTDPSYGSCKYPSLTS